MKRRKFVQTISAATLLAGTGSGLASELHPASRKGLQTDNANFALANTGPDFADDLQPVVLMPPQKDGGKSVLASLQERKTMRKIKTDALPAQLLSNLLWAAFGVNRDTGKGPFGRTGRTAASPSNSQEIDIYVFLPEGIYLYEAISHRLNPVTAGDQRAQLGGFGRSKAVADAPVNLVFVADLAKYADSPFMEPGLKDPDIQKSYYNITTGLIAGNVYLFAASQGIAAWFHNCNKEEIAKVINIRPDQRVLYAQTVGYPEVS